MYVDAPRSRCSGIAVADELMRAAVVTGPGELHIARRTGP